MGIHSYRQWYTASGMANIDKYVIFIQNSYHTARREITIHSTIHTVTRKAVAISQEAEPRILIPSRKRISKEK